MHTTSITPRDASREGNSGATIVAVLRIFDVGVIGNRTPRHLTRNSKAIGSTNAGFPLRCQVSALYSTGISHTSSGSSIANWRVLLIPQPDHGSFIMHRHSIFCNVQLLMNEVLGNLSFGSSENAIKCYKTFIVFGSYIQFPHPQATQESQTGPKAGTSLLSIS